MKLLDKAFGLIASKEPMAFQAVQAMNQVGFPEGFSVVSSDDNERRLMDDPAYAHSGDLDDPSIADELSRLI